MKLKLFKIKKNCPIKFPGVIQASQIGGIEVFKVSKENFDLKVKGQTREGVDEIVTFADFNSHCVMQLSLNRIFPNLKIISEEDVPDSKCPASPYFDFLNPTVLSESISVPDEHVKISDLSVFIDPLDATKEFTEKLFHYVTVMLCVVYKNEPIIGVIHNPFQNITYWAWKDRAKSENLLHVKKVFILNPHHQFKFNHFLF
jgi:inositol monophosphatase 3